MYYYVYDEFLQEAKYERELAQIETRLTDLGIAGKIARLALFRDATELIEDEIRKGAKNIIAVGNDTTLRKVMDAAAGKDVCIGIIPIGNNGNEIAHIIGVPAGQAACDVLSARIIESLDMGIVNGRPFLHEAFCQFSSTLNIECDGQFKLTPEHGGVIRLRNLALATDMFRAAIPTDGKLDLVLEVHHRKWYGKKDVFPSVIPLKKITVLSSEPVSFIADGQEFQGEEFRFSVLEGYLRVITGKERKF